MTASLKAVETPDLAALMTALARQTRGAARALGLASAEQKNRALESIERAIRTHSAPASRNPCRGTG